MNFIFADNYRGFSNLFIPIKQVNFLVGENSTGKTSIMGIIDILSKIDFLSGANFNNNKNGFKTFSDFVSLNSEDKSFFRLGFVFDQTVEESNEQSEVNNSLVVLAVTFVKDEGMPKLKSVYSLRNNIEIILRFLGNNFRYIARKSTVEFSSEEFQGQRYIDWLEKLDNEKTGFTKLRGGGPFPFVHPPVSFIIPLLEQSAIDHSDEDSETIDLDIGVTSFLDRMTWFAPIRSKPRKIYDEYNIDFSPEGDHTPFLIKKKLNSKSESDRLKTFLAKFGNSSGLFDSIEIKNYGRGLTKPFELEIVINNKSLSVSRVGYGVSQILPVIVELYSRPKSSWFAIQQPEVHLHPKAQAAFGEALYDLAKSDKKKFFVETHSDYTIDRFRMQYRKISSNIDSQILFFERSPNGNRIFPIPIDLVGNISADQPNSYREFFIKEELNILGL